MTNHQYIAKSLSRLDITSDEVDLIIVENQLDAASEVNVRECKQAICKSFGVWIPLYSSMSEGGVSKSWNLEAVKLYYSGICKELGKIDISQPTVRDRSNVW